MPKDTRRCASCVLPETPLFDFDGTGTCCLCNTAKGITTGRVPSTTPERRDVRDLSRELERRIQQIRREGRGRRFDCVVGLSGGRDSTYLLYLLRRKHDLRCLAAYYRTPFTDSVIDENVKRVVSKLGVPLVAMDISQERHRRLARELVLLWRKKPHPVLGNMLCAPCKLVNRELFRIARANRVKAIVCGANPYEAVQIAASVSRDGPTSTHVHLGLAKQLHRTLSLAKNGCLALVRDRELLRYFRLGIQASIMYVHPHTPYLRLRFPGIQAMEYFYYHPWNQEECEEAIADMGWVLPPGCNSTWKSDCAFGEIKNHVFRTMTGITYLDAFLSNMVRAGALDRDVALRRLKTEGVPSARRLGDACRTLDLPEETFASPIRC